MDERDGKPIPQETQTTSSQSVAGKQNWDCTRRHCGFWKVALDLRIIILNSILFQVALARH